MNTGYISHPHHTASTGTKKGWCGLEGTPAPFDKTTPAETYACPILDLKVNRSWDQDRFGKRGVLFKF